MGGPATKPAPERIVVCGAGVVGAAVAYELALRGAPPTVVERRRPGAAASGKAGGFLALDWNDGTPVGPLARASFTRHAELATELGADAGYRQLETLLVAAVEGGSTEPHRRLPGPAWIDGGAVVHSVVGTPQTTAQVDPARFTRALVHASTARGARVVTGVVDGLDLGGPGGAVRAVSVDGQWLPADVVVLAMGPWTAAAQAWLPLPMVYGLKGASVTFQADLPAQALFGDMLMADGSRRSPEVYPRADGTVYVNGYPEDDPLPDDPDAIHPSDEACAALQRMAALCSRALSAAPLLARRACYRPVTLDGIPLIGPHPEVPGVFVATGHGAWGILNAPATGQLVAQLVLGQLPVVDPAPFALGRMSAMRR